MAHSEIFLKIFVPDVTGTVLKVHELFTGFKKPLRGW